MYPPAVALESVAMIMSLSRTIPSVVVPLANVLFSFRGKDIGIGNTCGSRESFVICETEYTIFSSLQKLKYER